MKLFFALACLILLLACGPAYSSNARATDAALIAGDIADARARDEMTEEARNHIVETDEAGDPFLNAPDPADLCVSWKEAHLHIGERTCVTGKVTSTYNSGNAFFINFTSNRTSFYLVSFDYTWQDLEGDCIIAHGEINTYENRPQIIIRDTSQLEGC